MIASNHVRPNGKPTSRARRAQLKGYLLANDPRCYLCSCELVAAQGRENSAHLVRRNLSCPKHIKEVRASAKLDGSDDLVHLTHKGQAYLDATRPPIQLVEVYIVDGKPFEKHEDAEARALELAQLLGAKIEILVGLVNSNRFKVSQIIRPGADARSRDVSHRREHRKSVESVTR